MMTRLEILKYFGFLSALALCYAIFIPWVTIDSLGLTLTGMDTRGTDFGKPGYFHLIMAGAYLILTFTPRIWAKRMNLLVVALNLAWAIRNFISIPACSGGECPDKQLGIFLMLACSVILMLCALFPDIKLEDINKRKI